MYVISRLLLPPPPKIFFGIGQISWLSNSLPCLIDFFLIASITSMHQAPDFHIDSGG